MKQWFNQLEKREQRLVIGAGILLFIFAIYSFVWQPLVSSTELLKTQTTSQRDVVEWMRTAAVEVKQLRKTTGARPSLPKGQSLLALVDETTKKSGLASSVKRIQPKGQNGAQVRLEQASFDNIMGWLNKLKQKQGIIATTVNIERLDAAGIVNARLSLEAPQ